MAKQNKIHKQICLWERRVKEIKKYGQRAYTDAKFFETNVIDIGSPKCNEMSMGQLPRKQVFTNLTENERGEQ